MLQLNVLGPQFEMFVVAVAFEFNTEHPEMAESVKFAVGGGLTQIIFTKESIPQVELPPTFILMEYDPVDVKLICKELLPGCQGLGLLEPRSFPKLPETIFQPVAGVIFHTIFPPVQFPSAKLDTTVFPVLLVLVKVTVEF